jgi:hypothetical protein
MALREIVVELGVEVDRRSQKKAEGAINSMESRVKGLIRAGQVLAAGFATGFLARGFISLIAAAGDANETLNKLEAVFGKELSPAVIDFANTTASAIGQSSLVFRGMLADVGAIVTPLLGSRDAAAQMSKGVAQLAFDFASLNNLDLQTSLEKITAGLVGSTIPLIRLGIDTRAAALEQFRLSKGIKVAFKDMDNASKTALRFAAITEGIRISGAIGDAKKTQFAFANATRALSGNVIDLKVALGQELIPTAEKVLRVLNPFIKNITPNLAKGFGSMLKATLKFAKSVGELGGVISDRLGPSFKVLIDAVKKLFGGTSNLSGVAVPLLTAAFNLLIIAIGTLVESVASIINWWNGLDSTMTTIVVTLVVMGITFNVLKGISIASAAASALAWIRAGVVFKLITGIVGALGFAFKLLGITLLFFTTPIGLIVIGIGLLIGLVILLATKWKAFPNAVLNFLANGLEMFLRFFQDIFGLSDDFIENVTETFRNSWENTIEFVTGLFGGMFDSIKGSLGPLGKLLGFDDPEVTVTKKVKQFADSPLGGAMATGVSPTPFDPNARAARVLRSLSAQNKVQINNSPRTEVNVSVTADTNASPADIADMVSKKMEQVTGQLNREALQSFAVTMGATG